MALGGLLWVTFSEQGHWIRRPPEVLSNINHSVVLYFCDYVITNVFPQLPLVKPACLLSIPYMCCAHEISTHLSYCD